MKILIAEDDTSTWRSLRRLLGVLIGQAEYDNATNGDDTLRLASNNQYDLITMDGNLSPGRGPEIVRALRAKGCETKIIMHCGEERELKDGLKYGANAGVMKPLNLQDLIAILKELGFVIN